MSKSLFRNTIRALEELSRTTTFIEMRFLHICFQQRHILQHLDGIVDQDYIDKSGDTTYQIGQHIIVKKESLLLYTAIVEKIGNHVLRLLGDTSRES